MKLMYKSTSADHFPPLIENFIIIAIIGVIIQTILDDITIIYHMSHDAVVISSIAGFCFDFLFTIEFIGRSYISYRRGNFKNYIQFQRGWIDAISSIPLLLLVSGPALLMIIGGQGETGLQLGFLSILKTAKAIRVTRILRLIRIIKLFGKIQNTESVMTNRHIGIVSTIATVTLVIVLVITQFIPFTKIGDQDEYFQERKKELSALLNTSPPDEWLVNYIAKSNENADIISLKAPSGKTIYENPKKKDLLWTAFDAPVKVGDYEITLSYYKAEADHAKANMTIFFSILGIIFSMMLIYSKIFVQQVADPLYVMNKGFRDWNYNLTVKENKEFVQDEVFKLAIAFNRTWLPLKNQIYIKKKMAEKEKSVLKMDDIF